MDATGDTYIDLSHATIERLALRITEQAGLCPADYAPVVLAGAGNAVVYGSGSVLYGFSVTSVAGGTFTLRDTDPASGVILAAVTVPAAGAATVTLPAGGVRVRGALVLVGTADAAATVLLAFNPPA